MVRDGMITNHCLFVSHPPSEKECTISIFEHQHHRRTTCFHFAVYIYNFAILNHLRMGTKPLRLRTQPKMSVFEKQLSLINSSSVGLKGHQSQKKKQPSMGYFSYGSANSELTINSSDSTLIPSSGPMSPVTSKHNCNKSANKSRIFKRKDSIHLRIPLGYFVETQTFIKKLFTEIYGYFASLNRDQLRTVFDLMSIFFICTSSVFSAEILKHDKILFLSCLPVTSICSWNLTRTYDSNSFVGYMDYSIHRNNQITTMRFKRMVIQIVFGAQVMALLLLGRATYILKAELSDERSNFDRFALLVLVLLITGLCANLLLNFIPLTFRVCSKQDQKEVVSSCVEWCPQ